jgi:enamine deaminase RidA (YjgF/YER057c/UK114 family)
MADTFSGRLPPTSIIQQPLLAGDGHLGLELWAFVPSEGPSRVIKYSDNLAVLDAGGLRWSFVSGLKSKNQIYFDQKVLDALTRTELLFKKAGFQFHDLIRTWFYAGNILKQEKGDVRYDVMNRVRNRFYCDVWRPGEDYPASTGIGINGAEFILDGIAVKPVSDNINIARIDNPLQTNPCDYDIDKSLEEKPTFCRCVVITSPDYQILFISGTASIRGSEVVFEADPKAQTETTIENIACLIGKDNLENRHGLGNSASLKDIQQIRVYIKNPEHGVIIRDVCETYFGRIPQLYSIADICRQNLLVEIEAVAVVRR